MCCVAKIHKIHEIRDIHNRLQIGIMIMVVKSACHNDCTCHKSPSRVENAKMPETGVISGCVPRLRDKNISDRFLVPKSQWDIMSGCTGSEISRCDRFLP